MMSFFKTEKTPFAMITDAWKDISKTLVEKDGIEDVNMAKKRLIELSPGLARDPMFHDVFPGCFGIAFSEYKIAQEAKTK